MAKYNKKFVENYTGTSEQDFSKRYIAKIIDKFNNPSVLDIGCGSGRFSRFVAKCGSRCLGIDLNINQIKKAREIEHSEPLGIDYVHDDFLEFKTNKKFQIALMSFVILDLPNKILVNEFFKKASSLLTKNGYLIISDIHPHNINRQNNIENSTPLNIHENYQNETLYKSITTLQNNQKIIFSPNYLYRLDFIINSLIHNNLVINNFLEINLSEEYPPYMIIRAKKLNLSSNHLLE